MSQTAESLPKWFDQLFGSLFFQPDDDLALKTFTEGFSPDFTARINSTKFTYAQFKEFIITARDSNTFTPLSRDEIMTWNAPEASGAGSVVQSGWFAATNRQTGEVSRTKAVTLATVGVVDGKRVLLELAETSKGE